MKPAIVVVIPNWNGAEMLKNCLHSLEEQTIKPKIIVVDNGSTDNSVGLVEKEFPAVLIIKHKKNRGFAGGVNAGIKRAIEGGAEYIALLNNDTEVERNWLKELIAEMKKDESCGIVASKVLKAGTKQLDNTGESFSIWGLPFPRSRDKKAATDTSKPFVFGASGGSTLYRAMLFKDIGTFDEDFFAYYEDADMNFRAQIAGWKARYAGKAVVNHKIGGTSGRVSGFTKYHTIKNLPWLFTKNVPTSLMLKMLPRFALLYSLIFLKALVSRHFLKVIQAFAVSLLLMPKKALQRYDIQGSKKVSSKYLNSILYQQLPPNSSLRRLAIFLKINT